MNQKISVWKQKNSWLMVFSLVFYVFIPTRIQTQLNNKSTTIESRPRPYSPLLCHTDALYQYNLEKFHHWPFIINKLLCKSTQNEQQPNSLLHYHIARVTNRSIGKIIRCCNVRDAMHWTCVNMCVSVSVLYMLVYVWCCLICYGATTAIKRNVLAPPCHNNINRKLNERAYRHWHS